MSEEVEPASGSTTLDEVQLEKDLAKVLNRHSAENASDTPDYILAGYLVNCLKAWNRASQGRDLVLLSRDGKGRD